MRPQSPSSRPGSVTPAATSLGTPAWSMYATGGLTHFIDGLEPEGPSVARRANFCPTGRAAQKAAKILRISDRPKPAKWRISSGQTCGHPRCSTNSRGRPNGKSKAPSHERSRRNQSSKLSRESSRSTPTRSTRPFETVPAAITIGLRRLGLLEKSQPIKSSGDIYLLMVSNPMRLGRVFSEFSGSADD